MQKRSWSTLVSLAVLMCVGDLANAGLYPTRPVAKTIFEAGNVETVKWKDSDEKPSLEDTPRLRMDLYVNDDVSGMILLPIHVADTAYLDSINGRFSLRP